MTAGTDLCETSRGDASTPERKLRITFVIKCMSAPGGGAERVLSMITRGLLERGHEISLITFDSEDSSSFYELDPRLNWERIPIGQADGRTSFAVAVKRTIALRKFLQEQSPDVAVAFMSPSIVLMSAALMGTRIPFVASEHIVPAYYTSRPLEYSLLKLMSRRAHSVTVLSETIRATYSKSLRQRMEVIGNPIEIEGAHSNTERAQRAKQKTIISVGRLEPQKDQKTLIDAFAHIAADFPEWNVSIFGEGSLRPDLEAQIKKLQLQDRVHLMGVHRQLAPHYNAANLFVLPSRYESFGLVTAEAMAHGLATVGFADCPGTNELIVHGETGLLAGAEKPTSIPDRTQVLAKAMAELMASSDLRDRYGANGRDRVRQFELSPIIAKWERLLFNAVGAPTQLNTKSEEVTH